jgi:hypothetical protein
MITPITVLEEALQIEGASRRVALLKKILISKQEAMIALCRTPMTTSDFNHAMALAQACDAANNVLDLLLMVYGKKDE